MSQGRPYHVRPLFSLVLFTALLAVLPLLGGCVYLRLLKVKEQLRNFEQNFEVSGTSEMVIELKNPILYGKDARFLIGADPLSQEKNVEDVYHYKFQIIRSTPFPETPLETLTLRLHVKNSKVTKLAIPENFLLLLPRPVIIESLRAAADANVNQFRRTAHVRFKPPPEAEAALPSLEKTMTLLGPPLKIKESPNVKTFFYRYQIIRDTKNVLILARFTYDREGRLVRIVVTWDTASADAEYIRS